MISAVMGEPIEQRRGHLGVGEDLRPLGEGEVGRDDQRGAFIEPTDQMEEQLATRLGERQIAELVQDDKVHAGQLIGESAGPSGLALGLKLVNEVHTLKKRALAPCRTQARAIPMARCVLPVPVPPMSTTLRCCASWLKTSAEAVP